MEKKELNELVLGYRVTKCENTFNKIYESVSKKWISLETVAKSVGSNAHEIKATYEDILLKCLEIYDGRSDFINLLNRCIWRERRGIYKKQQYRKRHEMRQQVSSDDSLAATIENIADETLVEDIVLRKRKADQRQLIDFLASGENERTTAIIQAFLTTELTTPTAIGKYLGLDHKQVTRVLNRLAAKFNTAEQFGKPEDWLIA